MNIHVMFDKIWNIYAADKDRQNERKSDFLFFFLRSVRTKKEPVYRRLRETNLCFSFTYTSSVIWMVLYKSLRDSPESRKSPFVLFRGTIEVAPKISRDGANRIGIFGIRTILKKNKYGNLGFKSESYVHFKKPKEYLLCFLFSFHRKYIFSCTKRLEKRWVHY